MKTEIRFDQILIESPQPPLESGLIGSKIRLCHPNQLGSLFPKKPIFYTKVAKGAGFTVLFEPIICNSYIKTTTRALLSIKAGNLSPKDIEQIALRVFGSLQCLKVSYIETRVDLFDESFHKIYTQLAVIGKQSMNYKYIGQTIYFGKASAGHQVVLYDKGLEQKRQVNTHIRIEARMRFVKKDRPPLQDLLTGVWQPKKPFRESYLINTKTLSLKREEKISVSKIGLTRFYMGLNYNCKTTLRKHMKRNILIDFNHAFIEWLNSWVDTNIQSESFTVDFIPDTEHIKPMGNLCYRLISIQRAYQYRLKNKDDNLFLLP